MAILGLQGVRGGTGTTSITAALAWALQLLGETVLVVDASPDNMLRFFFNVDFSHKAGWARATIDGTDWRDAGLRYTAYRFVAFWSVDAGRAREYRAAPADAGADGRDGAEAPSAGRSPLAAD